MPSRSPVQIPNDLKTELESFRIRLAGDTGRIPVMHEVIRAVFVVGSAHYTETLKSLKEMSETS